MIMTKTVIVSQSDSDTGSNERLRMYVTGLLKMSTVK